MTEDLDLTCVETHFAFGRNWASYARNVTQAEIVEAESGLLRLLGADRLAGARFLDIGCGSGLHSLAALRLGAKEVVAVDLDPDSVATTQGLLQRHAPHNGYEVKALSVFALSPQALGAFDIVYSWGVLHHTGNMNRAICCAAAMVRPGGLFAFALYRRVWMDFFWRWEKRWYARASANAQRRARALYLALFRMGLLATGRRFSRYVEGYRSNRGMDFYHDVHDWLGGWPYESISPREVDVLLQEEGFVAERILARKGYLLGRHPGIFGSGCDEYVYRKL